MYFLELTPFFVYTGASWKPVHEALSPQVPALWGSGGTHLLGLSLPPHTQSCSLKWRGKQLAGPRPASAHLLAGWEWATGQTRAEALPHGASMAWGEADGASAATEAWGQVWEREGAGKTRQAQSRLRRTCS